MPRKKRTHGEGTIYQRSDDGRWVAQITVDGKRYTFSGKSREEVLAKLQQAQAARLRGDFVAPSKLTLGEWLETWLDTYKKGNISENTYKSYANTIQEVGGSIPPAPTRKIKARRLRCLRACTFPLQNRCN